VTDVDISPGDAFAVVSAAPSSALDRGRHVLVVERAPELPTAVSR
jgi:cell shape-determining protein MreC